MSLFDSMARVMHRTLLSTHGQSITYTPAGGSAETITGIVEAGEELEERQAGAQWSLWVDLSDLSNPANGDQMTASGITGVTDGDYRVVDVRKDGVGGAWIDLQYIRSYSP